ncbi:MAG: baseplate J/gp47 family protein [Flavobacterium sp.]|nr:baseplate J/gp47 family protein [Flavobacterium sp.]
MKKIDTFSHYREGKSQMQRFLAELDPTKLELHDFDLFDWLLFANNFARHVKYFQKDSNDQVQQETWESFFLGADDYTIPRRESLEYKELKKQVTALIAQFEQDGSLTPHLTLFVCFIQLLDFSKKDFNDLTKEHLDFYYKKILQIEKQEAKADKAYVIFELAKKAVQEKIPQDTLLDAKKDLNGKKLVFKTDKEFVANQAKVMEVKSFLNDPVTSELKMARKADTLDGLKEKLPENGNYWWPFGYNSDEVSKLNYKALEDAKFGFSIASPLFNLKEGERTVSVTITFKNKFSPKLNRLSEIVIANNFELLLSGAKEWLTAHISECVKTSTNQLTLKFILREDFPAVVNYNKALLGAQFETSQPLARFILKQYDLYDALSENDVSDISILVDVKGIKSAVIENDGSKLNSEKPFFPFTAQPVKGSNFYVKYPEMFDKKWDTAEIVLNWKNAPASIKDYYSAYTFEPDNNITKKTFNSANTSVVTDDNYFKVDAALLDNEKWIDKEHDIVLFQKLANDKYRLKFSVTNSGGNSGTAEAIRLTLKKSALQDVYPKIYTLALTNTATGSEDKPIPNEPYIPFAEDLVLNYTATGSAYTSQNSSKPGTVTENSEVQLFLEDVFGQYKKEIDDYNIVPVHHAGGELYIGLNALKGQTISLLAKVLEGSENPLAETFKDTEKIQWSILSGNQWTDLSKYIVSNDTKNLLESGILQFMIPKDLNTSYTRLPNELVWVRAVSGKRYDAVCKIQGLYTQAVLATFDDSGNELSHLKDGLPAGNIDKLVTRVAQIKSVSQPYNAFGGTYQETDPEFYRRISERLRHKYRAISQWDYEQLILQEFPEVFKVKCLNHTSEKSYMTPGNVTLMVVPDTTNRNAFDIYQPRVSRSTLNNISAFINELNTMHVKAQVINPNYVEVKVATEVQFFSQFDKTFYSKQLDEDIKKYISPWAFANTKDIIFDVKLNVNQLVNYLERLHYVDYIDNLKIYVNNVLQEKYLIEVEPKSILVSAKQHDIAIAAQICI